MKRSKCLSRSLYDHQQKKIPSRNPIKKTEEEKGTQVDVYTEENKVLRRAECCRSYSSKIIRTYFYYSLADCVSPVKG
jgi:hypothetical protein